MYKVYFDGLSSKTMSFNDAKRFAKYCLYRGCMVSIKNVITNETIKF